MVWDIFRHAVTFGRVTLTPYTFGTIFLPAYLSYYALAVLVQLPHTNIHRAALLPVVFWMCFRANMSLDLSGNQSERAVANHWLAFGLSVIVMRGTVWAFANQPFTRLPLRKVHNDTSGRQNGAASTDGVSIASALWHAWDLTVNLRNIGWIGPQQVHLSAPYLLVESRPMFFLLSLSWSTLLLLVFDVLSRSVRSFGSDTFKTPTGGTIFDPALPPLERYMASSFITLLFGLGAYMLIDATYQLHAALYTALFQQYPSQWPPLFDAPMFSTSLSSFWGRRWHQLFREPFVVIGGGLPGMFFGRAGAVMGAFALSGVLHDVGLRGVGRGSDTPSVTGFFLMQGVGVLMEHAWRQATGRRVGGFVGWLWTMSWLVGWGQLMVDAWARKGLLASRAWPEAYRPTTYLLNWIARASGAA